MTVTRSSLRKDLNETLTKDTSSALIYFSGHGALTKRGTALVTQDCESYDEGVLVSEVLELANDSPVPEVVILLDCCHAANARTTNEEMRRASADLRLTEPRVTLREGVCILAASGRDQVAVEGSGGGLFTSLVCNALDGGAADFDGKITVTGVYAYASRRLSAWDQRPRIMLNCPTIPVLREGKPLVKNRDQKRISKLFEKPDEHLQLDPSFVMGPVDPDNPKHKAFRRLTKLASRGLVVPVDAADLTSAALQSKSCKLTRVAEQLWHAAHQKYESDARES
jgi:hypothetical protein